MATNLSFKAFFDRVCWRPAGCDTLEAGYKLLRYGNGFYNVCILLCICEVALGTLSWHVLLVILTLLTSFLCSLGDNTYALM